MIDGISWICERQAFVPSHAPIPSFFHLSLLVQPSTLLDNLVLNVMKPNLEIDDFSCFSKNGSSLEKI